MLKLYNNGVLVAKQIDNTYVEDTGTGLELPYELWGTKNKGKVLLVDTLKWLFSRVPPEDQDNIENFLKKVYDLDCYNQRDIVLLSNAESIQDNYSAKYILPKDLSLEDYEKLKEKGVFNTYF